MKGRDRLKELAPSGKYVFHGSPIKSEKLLPRQPTIFDRKVKKMVADGEPAVAATPFYEIAIFRALINRTICKEDYKSNFGSDNGVPFFKASKGALEAVRRPGLRGFVYVLDAQSFSQFRGSEMRSQQAQNPIGIVEVTVEDLPNNIEVF